jgi:hypothetical protein
MSTDKSLRFNEGKIQTRELDPDFILGMGEVLTRSRGKYEHFNWQKPTNFSTPFESMMRHLMAFQKGEEVDSESLCHHLLHCAVNIMFLHYHATNNTGIDDRGFKKSLTIEEDCDIINIGDLVVIKVNSMSCPINTIAKFCKDEGNTCIIEHAGWLLRFDKNEIEKYKR